MRQRGFTIIELLFVTIVLIGIGVLFWVQKSNIEVTARDDTRRTAINAMYYDLEEVYYPAHMSYPKKLNATTLNAMDSALLKDPNSIAVGEADSDYRYEPTNCTGSNCTGYSLRASLENEADFVKKNKH